MSTNADTSGAGAFITFTDGKTYQMRPLDGEDMDLLTEYVQASVINMVEKSLPPGCPEAVYERRMSLAIREASKLSWMSGADKLRNVDGLVQMAYLALRHEHPDIDRAYVREQLMKPGIARQFSTTWRKINGVVKKGASGPGSALTQRDLGSLDEIPTRSSLSPSSGGPSGSGSSRGRRRSTTSRQRSSSGS